MGQDAGMALPEDLQELARRVSNRGRWGSDDQRGTLNLITPEATQRGVRAAKTGRAFSLAIPMNDDGPQTGGIPGRINPQHRMIAVSQSFTGVCTRMLDVTMPVFTLVAVTSTPGIKAPVASATVPTTVAFTWANAAVDKSSIAKTAIEMGFRTMNSPPIEFTKTQIC